MTIGDLIEDAIAAIALFIGGSCIIFLAIGFGG